MQLSTSDRERLLPQLDRLNQAVEELLQSGLTTASDATRHTLGVTFQEVSRCRLLRLGGTLRAANEELGRYINNEPAFSQRRFVFFLSRAWLLGRGIARALRENDQQQLDKLLWTAPAKPVDELNVVTLGVVKRMSVGAFCSFEFRLRGVDDGRPYVWSTVFPLKAGVDIPPEGFLHIPQKQKFTANIFLEKKNVVLRDVAVAQTELPISRIQLGEQSRVEVGEPFSDYTRFAHWDCRAALERIRRHEPGPFDLDVELQEDVVLFDWSIGEREADADDGWIRYPLMCRGVVFDARVSSGVDGKPLQKALEAARKKKKKSAPPPLFGVLHYEACRLVLQPLSLLTSDGPEYITVSQETIDRKALLQTLRFT